MTLDPTNFDTFYSAHASAVYRSALGIVRDPDAAADVVQEAFVRAYTAVDEIVSPAAWLSTVARRLALDELRRRKRLTGLAEDALDEDEPIATTLVENAVWADPAKSAASADSVAVAGACVAELRPDDRTLLTFRYAEGLEIAAIADLLGRTVNATTVALHRARARFDRVYADRVFSRAGVPESCRPWQADATAHADGKPVWPEYLSHLASCASCQETDADLRSRSKAFALAPLIGFPLIVPVTLKAAILTSLVGNGIALGTAGVGGVTAAGTMGTGAVTVVPTSTVATASAAPAIGGTSAFEIGITAKVAIVALACVVGAVGISAAVGFSATSEPQLLTGPSRSPISTALPAAGVDAGVFTKTGAMTLRRGRETSTLLSNGQVLIVGGEEIAGSVTYHSAELYNPASGTFTKTHNTSDSRHFHTATMLPNGLVLIAGGGRVDGASAELYDSASGTFTPTGDLTVARSGQTATLLKSGLVLIAGGGRGDTIRASAELYDPASGTFTQTGDMSVPRYRHTATLLANGLVLIAGGDGTGSETASAELYDPATGTFTRTGDMVSPRAFHTATLLANGLVLIAGGFGSGAVLASAELYDPDNKTFTETGDMTYTRLRHTATLLADGHILMAGGRIVDRPGGHFVSPGEIYDPATGTFTPAGDMPGGRDSQTATLLPDGRVLLAGGFDSGACVSSAVLFE